MWVPDFLSRYDPDPLRYYLAANMPETGDANFSWPEFVRRNNGELVGTYGNLCHRVLTFLQRNFEGIVPAQGEVDDGGRQLLEETLNTLESVDSLLSQCRFRESVRHIMSLAQNANRYLDEKAPWKNLRTDPQGAGTSVWVCSACCRALRPCCILSCLSVRRNCTRNWVIRTELKNVAGRSRSRSRDKSCPCPVLFL